MPCRGLVLSDFRLPRACPLVSSPHQHRCLLLQAELIKQGDQVAPELQLPLPAGAPAGALGMVLERSRQLCLQMYEKQLFSGQAAEQAYDSSKLGLSATQQGVYAGQAAACILVLAAHGGVLPMMSKHVDSKGIAV